MAQAIKSGTQHTTKTSEKKEKAPKGDKKDKLPFGKRFAVQAQKARAKFEKAIKKVIAVDNAAHTSIAVIKEAAANAALNMTALEKLLNALPDNFSPKGEKTSSGGPVEVGATVAVREKKRAEYDGLIEVKELESLKVLAIKGPKVLLQTAGGNKLFMSKSHVAVVKATVEAKAA